MNYCKDEERVWKAQLLILPVSLTSLGLMLCPS